MAEVALEFFIRIRRHAEGPDMKHLSVEERFGIGLDILYKGLHEVLWLAAGSADEYPVTGMDVTEYHLLRDELLWVLLF